MEPSGAESRLAYARFPAGFGPVIGRCLERASIRGARLMDEACVFPARAKPERRVAGLFTALYQVVDRLEPAARPASADYCAAEFARKLGSLAPGRIPARGRNGAGQSFRARVLLRNEPAAIPGEALSRLEDAFSALSGLRPDRRGGGGELCVLLRAEGEAFLLFRESTAEPLPSPFGDPVPGELPAHTARLLCECSSPRDDDLFLDPFAGTGSLPFQRALMAPFRLVFAQDIDPDCYDLIRSRLASKPLAPYKKRIFPKLRDARDLSSFQDGSVTAIVTDPPWGHWEGGRSGAEASGILQSFLDSARRVLAPEGHIVLLLSRGMADAFPLGDGVARSYRLIERLDVLISGRKASVVVME